MSSWPSRWPPLRGGTLVLLLAVAACNGGGFDSRVPTEITLNSTNVTLAAVGQNLQLTATVLDQNGDPIADAPVAWTSANPAIVSVSGTGLLIAQGPGTAAVTATAGEASGTATVNVKTYDITIRYLSDITNSQRLAFSEAERRWESLVIGDLPDVQSLPADPPPVCHPQTPGPFDDLTIFVTIDSIDGPDGTLGQAGPCFVRSTGNLPITGRMQFDVEDMEILEAEGSLQSVILHEMAHVVGFGTVWKLLGLLQDSSVADPDPPLADTHFTGALAIAAFNAAGGTGYTGAKVPVMNTGGAGTVNSHWRDGVFDPELMTGFLNIGFNPLSAISVRSLQDLGYVVSVAGADPFTLAPGFRIAGRRRGRHLINDIISDPIRRVTADGRVVDVIRP